MQEILPPETPRARHDGWTAARREAFCAALAKSGSVTEACALVGKSTTSAYKARERVRGFRNRWDEALAQVSPAIEAEVYRRAVQGWEEPVFHAGRQVGVRRRYSDALLRMMALRGTKVEPWEGKAPMPIEEVQRVLLQRLDRMARHDAARAAAERRAAREAAAAEADRMRAAGLCP